MHAISRVRARCRGAAAHRDAPAPAWVTSLFRYRRAVTTVTDVTDATFEQDVLDRSVDVPVVVDLWAPWCGPCRTLGPILEKVVEASGGAVELVKVNVDDNPRVSTAFQVQSIPAVFAVRDRQIVDHFIGALPEPQVAEFIARLAPAPSEADELVAAGDEASLRRALELEPDHPAGVVALARLLVTGGQPSEALELLTRIPETADVAASSPPKRAWPPNRSRSPPTGSTSSSTRCCPG